MKLSPSGEYKAGIIGDDYKPEETGSKPKLQDRFFRTTNWAVLITTTDLQRYHDPQAHGPTDEITATHEEDGLHHGIPLIEAVGPTRPEQAYQRARSTDRDARHESGKELPAPPHGAQQGRATKPAPLDSSPTSSLDSSPENLAQH